MTSKYTLIANIDYFSFQEYVNEMRTLIVNILTALNPEISSDTYADAADGIIQLETALAEVWFCDSHANLSTTIFTYMLILCDVLCMYIVYDS